jgi:HEAT repeat protein
MLSRREKLHLVLSCLSDLGPAAKEAEPELLALLAERRAVIVASVIEAAHALWRIRGDAQSVIPVLLNVLNSRGTWGHVERQFGGAEVIFGKAWSSTPHDVSRAASILGEIGPDAKEAVPILREALAAANGPIRTSAAVALWRIEGDAEATVQEILRDLAEESPPFSRAAFGMEPAADESREEALVEAGSRMIPRLVEALKHPQPQVRARAAKILGLVGLPAKQAISHLAPAARDPDIRVANAAIRALRRSGPKAGRPSNAFCHPRRCSRLALGNSRLQHPAMNVPSPEAALADLLKPGITGPLAVFPSPGRVARSPLRQGWSPNVRFR